jgi:hypothetical protein
MRNVRHLNGLVNIQVGCATNTYGLITQKRQGTWPEPNQLGERDGDG